MDRIGAGALGQGEDLLDVEIGLPGTGSVEEPGIVSQMHEVSIRICTGVHGDGLDAEVMGGPDDAQGDLTAIGDEDAAHCSSGDVGVQLCGRRFGENCGHDAPLYDHSTI